MATTYLTAYSDTTTVLTNAAGDFRHNFYIPAGTIESVILRFKNGSASEICDGSPDNLLSQWIVRLNGSQVANINPNVNANDDDSIGRFGAMVLSASGRHGGDVSATAIDYYIEMPLGVTVPNQCRWESELRTIAGKVATSGDRFDIILKYSDKVSSSTVFGNSTTENIGTSQTMVQVKVPDYGQRSRLIGVAILEPTDETKITGIRARDLGDFSYDPDFMAIQAGFVGGDQLYYPDPDTATAGYTFVRSLGGYHFVNLYGLDTSQTGQATLLIDASDALTNCVFVPILSLPTKADGERTNTQTAGKVTSGESGVIDRAEA